MLIDLNIHITYHIYSMLFRSKINKFIDIKRSNYTNDKEYYNDILATKKKELQIIEKNEKDRLLLILRESRSSE